MGATHVLHPSLCWINYCLPFFLLHLFLYNRYWLSGFSIFVVQLWNKNRFFYPIFLPAIPSKNFLQKYEKYSIHSAVLMI